MFRKHLLTEAVLLGLIVGLLAPVQGTAADFPKRPIELIVPYSAGGITDTLARLLTGRSAEYLGQAMVVLNKPGAGGALGIDFVAKSKPDGYTLGSGASSTLPILNALRPSLSYDPVKDFTPICQYFMVPSVTVVRADSRLNTFEKLIDYAKKNPGKLNYSSAGMGSTQHFACELLMQIAGIKMVHIPYKGSAPALMALLGGHVDLSVQDLVTPMEQIKAGKVIPLAVTAPERFSDLPDVPSVAEKYPGAVVVSWGGIVAPAGLPEPIVDKLAKYFQKVLALPDVQKRMKELGGTPTYRDPEEFGKFIRSEVDKFSDLAKKANIKIE